MPLPCAALETYLEKLRDHAEARSGINNAVRTNLLRAVSLEPLPAFLLDSELFLTIARPDDDLSISQTPERPIPAILRRLIEHGNRKELWMALSEQVVRLRELSEEVDDEADAVEPVQLEMSEPASPETLDTADALAAELGRWHEAVVATMDRHRDAAGVGISGAQYAAVWCYVLEAYRIHLDHSCTSAGFPFKNPYPHLRDLIEQLNGALDSLQRTQSEFGLRLDDESRADLLQGVFRLAEGCWGVAKNSMSDRREEVNKLQPALAGIVCKALVILTAAADLRLHASWFARHMPEKLSPGMKAAAKLAAQHRGGHQAVLEAIKAVSTGIRHIFDLDLQDVAETRSSAAHSPFNLYATLIACAICAASADGATVSDLSPLMPLLGSALNGSATLQDAACTIIADSLQAASATGRGLQRPPSGKNLPGALNEDDASMLIELLTPVLGSLSPAPEWDLDRFAIHNLLGEIINAVATSSERCELFLQILSTSNPFLKTRAAALALLREAIVTSLSPDDLARDSLFQSSLLPLVLGQPQATPPRPLRALSGGPGIVSTDSTLANLLDMSAQALWISPDPQVQDDLSFFCAWSVEALKICYALQERNVLMLTADSASHFFNVRSAVNRWQAELKEVAPNDTHHDLIMTAELTLFSLDLALQRIDL